MTAHLIGYEIACDGPTGQDDCPNNAAVRALFTSRTARRGPGRRPARRLDPPARPRLLPPLPHHEGADPMTQPTDPFRIASAVWQDLCDYQPGAAAALTIQLKHMPEDWPLRVFGVGRADAATALPPAAVGEVFNDMRPEIPPYAEHSFDECPACIEADDNCRYHKGYAEGHHEVTQAQLDAVKANPAITLKEFLQQQATEEPTR